MQNFAEDLHSLPVGQMGNYQEYVKSLEAVGRGALREVEPQAIRVHAFGNPFKIDKVGYPSFGLRKNFWILLFFLFKLCSKIFFYGIGL